VKPGRMVNSVLHILMITGCLLVMTPFVAHAQDEQQAPPEDPVSWSIKSRQAIVKAGGKFTIQLTAQIEKSWHLYSLEQEEGGPIPTRIKLPPDPRFEMAGEIESPAPQVKFDKNFNLNTEFYEGEVTFTLPVKVATGASPGQQKLVVQVRYQSCNDSICLPPKLVKVEADITIQAGK
jgi:DsbC/DsbD-like thiol-disulfide interchange protein